MPKYRVFHISSVLETEDAKEALISAMRSIDVHKGDSFKPFEGRFLGFRSVKNGRIVITETTGTEPATGA